MINHVLNEGVSSEDRTGTGTIRVFGYQTRYDLSEGFPLLTTKDMSNLIPKVFHELMWFIKGETNIRYLLDRNVNIWNPDAYRWYKASFPESEKDEILPMKDFIAKIKAEDEFAEQFGDLGRIYGKQWTDFGGIGDLGNGVNQIDWLINEIKTNPNSRRLIVSAWNPYDMDEMALPPCHVLMQFSVMNGKLSCQLYQRSGDLFLGVPFNISSYSMLVHMIAHLTNLEVGEFIHTFGDLHIYNNHIEQVTTQVQREPHTLPKLSIKGRADLHSIRDFEWEDFELTGYTSHGKLTGKVSVG